MAKNELIFWTVLFTIGGIGWIINLSISIIHHDFGGIIQKFIILILLIIAICWSKKRRNNGGDNNGNS